MNIIKRGKTLCLAGIGLSLIFGLSSIGSPLSAVCLYSSLAAILIAFGLATLFGLRKEREEYKHGVALMNIGWVFLSFAIALELLAMSPFYRAPGVNLVIAMVSQGVLGIVGLYILLAVHRALGVPYAP